VPFVILEFAARLDAAIDDAAITKQQVAEHLDVSPNRVSEWVNGHGVPKLPQAVSLAELLDVTLDWLLTGDPGLNHPERELVGEIAGLASSLARIAARARRISAGASGASS
jgi:transcriptional regulator with XRE-family HTH domain